MRTFLANHPIIPQILLESVPHLKKYFGANVVCNLRAPIDEGGSRTISAVVMWPGEVRSVRQALGGFDDSWWIARTAQTAGLLTFTYELV